MSLFLVLILYKLVSTHAYVSYMNAYAYVNICIRIIKESADATLR